MFEQTAMFLGKSGASGQMCSHPSHSLQQHQDTEPHEGPGVLTSRSKGSGAQQEVGAGTADEAHHIVGRLQVVPEAHILMVQHII